MKRLLLVAVAAAAIGIATPSWAPQYECGWVITSFDNQGCPQGYQYNDSCGCGADNAPRWYGGQLVMKVENEGGNGVSASQFAQAGRESAEAWSGLTDSNFQVDASTTLAANSSARWGDHNNNQDEHGIFFVSSESEWQQVTGSGAGGTLGVTVSPFWGNCGAREFVDSDILINGFVYGGWTFSSVKSTIMHEMGHSLGLGHPCMLGMITGSCSNECQALMAASGGEYSTPQQDDANGLKALYPGTPGGLGSQCSGPGNCSAAPICVTYQGFSYCTHTCGTCETGYECKAVNSQNVCVRKGAPAVGDTCTGVCESGAVCISTSGNTGTCYKSCTPGSNPTGCQTDYSCVELQGGGGACWPPGTQAEGQTCGQPTPGDCAGGLVCVVTTSGATTGTCFRSCDEVQPDSCGSGKLCAPLQGGGGICMAAAQPNADCEVTDYICVSGWQCSPADSGPATCHRECTRGQTDSCGPGEVCQDWFGQDNTYYFSTCYPEGSKQEGEACAGMDCAAGLICVTVATSRTVCLVLCNPSAPNCPHAGQRCDPLSNSSDGVCFPAGGSGGDGGSATDGGSSRDAGVVNPNGAGYLAACESDGECKWGICRGVGGRGSICLMPCDPRLGHYDCPAIENSGCVPNDPEGLNLGGQCQPDVAAGATLGVGDTCNVQTGYQQCTSGLCESGICLIACNNGGCPKDFQCDTSEFASPGICRPQTKGPCSCTAAADDDVGRQLALLLLASLVVIGARRRA